MTMVENVEVEDRQAQPVLSVRTTVAVSDLVAAQQRALEALFRFIQKRGIAETGRPFVRYHAFGEAETDVEVGVPVSAVTDGEGKVQATELPGGPVARTWHFGAHDNLAESYQRLQEWMTANGREPRGAPWEVYHWVDARDRPDPASWPPPSEWQTELAQPIR